MLFAIKSRLLNKPGNTISGLFVIFVLGYSYLLRIFEAPYYRALPIEDDSYRLFDSFFTPMWLCIITLTTVGYGDVYAVTAAGKSVSVCMAISGAFLMALVVTIVTSQVELDSKQKLALSHMQLSRKAALTVQQSLKYFLAKKKLYYMLEIQNLKEGKTGEEWPRTKFMKQLYSYSSQVRNELEVARLNPMANKFDQKKGKIKDDTERVAVVRRDMINAMRDFVSEKSEMTAIEDDRSRSLHKTS